MASVSTFIHSPLLSHADLAMEQCGGGSDTPVRLSLLCSPTLFPGLGL